MTRTKISRTPSVGLLIVVCTEADLWFLARMQFRCHQSGCFCTNLASGAADPVSDIVQFRNGAASLPDYPCVRAAGRAAPPSAFQAVGPCRRAPLSSERIAC